MKVFSESEIKKILDEAGLRRSTSIKLFNLEGEFIGQSHGHKVFNANGEIIMHISGQVLLSSDKKEVIGHIINNHVLNSDDHQLCTIL